MVIIINVMTFGLSGPGSQPFKRLCVPLGAVSWLAALSFVLFCDSVSVYSYIFC